MKLPGTLPARTSRRAATVIPRSVRRAAARYGVTPHQFHGVCYRFCKMIADPREREECLRDCNT